MRLQSAPGRGATFHLQLPLTLSVVRAVVVDIAGEAYAFPLTRIERIVRLHDHPVRSVAGRQMLVLSDGALPIVDAAEQFGGTPCGSRSASSAARSR